MVFLKKAASTASNSVCRGARGRPGTLSRQTAVTAYSDSQTVSKVNRPFGL